MRPEIWILGAGGFAHVVTDLLIELEHRVAGYAVSPPFYEPGMELLNRPVVNVNHLASGDMVVCAVVSPLRERLVMEAAQRRVLFVHVIHDSAIISRTADVGAGSIVNRGAVLDTGCEVEEQVIVNRGALLGHHVAVGKFSTIGPGANLAGHVVVGRRCFIGMGAQILEGRTIGDGAIVGAGSVVTHDVRPRTTVMGIPAREIE